MVVRSIVSLLSTMVSIMTLIALPGEVLSNPSTANEMNQQDSHDTGTLRRREQRDEQDEAPRTVKTLNVPFTANALSFTSSSDSTKNHFGDCPQGGSVDAQYTTDLVCQLTGPCNVGWTEHGEWLAYEFFTTDEQVRINPYDDIAGIVVDITVRVASVNPTRIFWLEVWENNASQPPTKFETPGKGYQHFEDVVWRNVRLEPTNNEHTLRVTIATGQVNVCAVTIKLVEIAPFTTSALGYSNFHDTTKDHVGNCGSGPVDAQRTSDEICLVRDHSECNIAYTQLGEWVSYNFQVADDDDYDIWLRLASLRDDSKVRLVLEGYRNPDTRLPQNLTTELSVSGKGWQTFADVAWPNLYLESSFDRGAFTLYVYFTTGQVNLCSVSVLYSTSYFYRRGSVPFTINALEFAEYIDKSSAKRGNCGPSWNPVDAQLTSDPICKATGDCNIAWTEPGEILWYNFETDGRDAVVNIVLRVASLVSNKTFRVEIMGDEHNHILTAPGKGWQEFEDVTLANVSVGTDQLHSMAVVFITGSMNLCSITMRYAF